MSAEHQRPSTDGRFRSLLISGGKATELRKEALTLPDIYLSTERHISDFELLACGGLFPLTGFLKKQDYETVVRRMQLANGTTWSMPIVFDVDNRTADSLLLGKRCAIRHPEGNLLGVITIEDVWQPDKLEEAHNVYGTDDPQHPGVNYLLNMTLSTYIGGPIEALRLPQHHTFNHLRFTPDELCYLFEKKGWKKIIAFQTRNPMHRAHVELTQKAMEIIGVNLLIHPTVGPTKADDVESSGRVPIYETVLKYYPHPDRAVLALLPKAMRFAGPKEAVWDAIIRRNYGATHFIVGRDHAGVKKDNGDSFYDPYAASDMAKQIEGQIGINIVSLEEIVYDNIAGRYAFVSEVPEPQRQNISASELRKMILHGEEIPAWFTYPEIEKILRRVYRERLNVSQLIRHLGEEFEKGKKITGKAGYI